VSMRDDYEDPRDKYAYMWDKHLKFSLSDRVRVLAGKWRDPLTDPVVGQMGTIIDIDHFNANGQICTVRFDTPVMGFAQMDFVYSQLEHSESK
jgi:hypothetical protein